ncbi:MAG: flagellar basal body P-ring protein FlgI [Spirochaetes bacterium]|nr:flagellar basal body P-ring protein FlgI [Spirochaetota bacterium]
MKKFIFTIILVMISFSAYAEVSVKVRDIAYIDGMKENQVMGFGLIVGLQGTGDSKIPVTQSSLKNLLKNMGLQEEDLSKSKNVAAVMITANLPSFVRVGDSVTVTVSSIGDAKSIEGGILVQSPLKGADNVVYVVAQGSVVTGKTGSALTRDKPVKTVGIISQGGIVEKEIVHKYIQNNSVSIVLKEWDFAVANQIAEQAKEEYASLNPVISQDGKITFVIPENVKASEFISKIENIEVTPSMRARVVINEKDGTIVMGGDVKISSSVISKAGMTIRIDGEDKQASALEMKDSSTVKDLVEALNYLGLTPADMISVLRTLKEAGALHADLIIR